MGGVGGGGGNGGGTLIGVGGSSHSSSSSGSSTSFLRYDESQQNGSNDYTDFDDEDDYSENDDDSDELPDSDNTLLNGLHFSFAGKRLQPNLCMYLVRDDLLIPHSPSCAFREPPPGLSLESHPTTHSHLNMRTRDLLKCDCISVLFPVDELPV